MDRIGKDPILAAALGGSGLVTIATLLTSVAGFRSASVLVGLTIFWEGVWVLQIAGVALLFAAFAWEAVPNLVGSRRRPFGVARRETLDDRGPRSRASPRHLGLHRRDRVVWGWLHRSL